MGRDIIETWEDALIYNLNDGNNFCFKKCPMFWVFLINCPREVFHNMRKFNTIFPPLIFFIPKILSLMCARLSGAHFSSFTFSFYCDSLLLRTALLYQNSIIFWAIRSLDLEEELIIGRNGQWWPIYPIFQSVCLKQLELMGIEACLCDLML